MDKLKQKYPFVEENILKYYNEKDKEIIKELNILNKEREMRIKAEEYKNEATTRCICLQIKLDAALKELGKLKKINNTQNDKYKD